jgi:hypothetical protein
MQAVTRAIFVIFWVGVLCAVESCGGHRSAGEGPSPAADPLAAFALLTTPISSNPVGARWIQSTGPVGPGLHDSALTVEKSVDSSFFEHNSEKRASLAFHLLKVLGVDASDTSATSRTFAFGGLEVVRVRSLDDLNWSDGATYVWEAARVRNFSFNSHSADTTAVHAALVKAGADSSFASPSLRLDRRTGNRIFVSGANLYIGVRILQFRVQRGGPDVIENWRGRTSGDLTPDYRLSIRPLQSTDHLDRPPPDGQCRALLIVQIQNVFALTTPPVKQFAIGCGNAGTLIQLASRQDSSGYTADVLDLGEDIVSRNTSGPLTFGGRIALRHLKLTTSQIAPSGALFAP